MKKSSASSAPRRPAPRRQAVIKAIEVQVEIRTELRTGSGTRLLSVRYDTATRHVKIWPDGRRELMPRSYTLSRRAY